MSLEENKSVYRNYVRRLAQPEHLDDVVAADFVAHDLPPDFPKGIEGLRAYRRAVMTAFPDQTSEILDLVAEGDKVSARLRLTATHSNGYAGLQPTGRKFQVQVFEMVRIEDRKVSERWSILDRADLMQQLGSN